MQNELSKRFFKKKDRKILIKQNLQSSSILMKSLIPRFSKNTPEEAVVLKKSDTSALSSPWKVGKWRYEASVLKEAAFQNSPNYRQGKENISFALKWNIF